MRKEEYNQLTGERTISIAALGNQTNRTLLYGYNIERKTWHVYLWNGVIHLLIYNFQGHQLDYRNYTEVPIDPCPLIPDKRLYPEACDFEFCSLLRDSGVILPFTTFDSNRVEQQFYGIKQDELPAYQQKQAAYIKELSS